MEIIGCCLSQLQGESCQFVPHTSALASLPPTSVHPGLGKSCFLRMLQASWLQTGCWNWPQKENLCPRDQCERELIVNHLLAAGQAGECNLAGVAMPPYIESGFCHHRREVVGKQSSPCQVSSSLYSTEGIYSPQLASLLLTLSNPAKVSIFLRASFSVYVNCFFEVPFLGLEVYIQLKILTFLPYGLIPTGLLLW